ncbi:MAG TPA: hypothetical protein ENI86_04170 [Acidimicrobiales bacterium]|nr:hypothetical protein [Acidimicrobiales bacterium]
MKKGRHRRYEEARRFQRDAASSFSVEDFDLDAPDPWALPKTSDDEEDDDPYADLAAKYGSDTEDDSEPDED